MVIKKSFPALPKAAVMCRTTTTGTTCSNLSRILQALLLLIAAISSILTPGVYGLQQQSRPWLRKRQEKGQSKSVVTTERRAQKKPREGRPLDDDLSHIRPLVADEIQEAYFTFCRDIFLSDDVIGDGLISTQDFSSSLVDFCEAFTVELVAGYQCPEPRFSSLEVPLQLIFVFSVCPEDLGTQGQMMCLESLNAIGADFGYIVTNDNFAEVEADVNDLCFLLFPFVFDIDSQPPSASPSLSPSAAPSPAPSVSPSVNPTTVPSTEPTISPSSTPSVPPSPTPSISPSAVPTSSPTIRPTISPVADEDDNDNDGGGGDNSDNDGIDFGDLDDEDGTGGGTDTPSPSPQPSPQPSSAPSEGDGTDGIVGPGPDPLGGGDDDDGGLAPGAILAIAGAAGLCLFCCFCLFGRRRRDEEDEDSVPHKPLEDVEEVEGDGSIYTEGTADLKFMAGANVDAMADTGDIAEKSVASSNISGHSSTKGAAKAPIQFDPFSIANIALARRDGSETGSSRVSSRRRGIGSSVRSSRESASVEAVMSAIDSANWDEVYNLASTLAEQEDLSTLSSAGKQSSRRASSTTSSRKPRSDLSAEDQERTKTLDGLVEAKDWTGVAVTAALYAGEGENKDNQRRSILDIVTGKPATSDAAAAAVAEEDDFIIDPPKSPFFSQSALGPFNPDAESEDYGGLGRPSGASFDASPHSTPPRTPGTPSNKSASKQSGKASTPSMTGTAPSTPGRISAGASTPSKGSKRARFFGLFSGSSTGGSQVYQDSQASSGSGNDNEEQQQQQSLPASQGDMSGLETIASESSLPDEALRPLRDDLDRAVEAGDWDRVVMLSTQVEQNEAYQASVTPPGTPDRSKSSDPLDENATVPALKNEMDNCVKAGDWALVSYYANRLMEKGDAATSPRTSPSSTDETALVVASKPANVSDTQTIDTSDSEYNKRKTIEKLIKAGKWKGVAIMAGLYEMEEAPSDSPERMGSFSPSTRAATSASAAEPRTPDRSLSLSSKVGIGIPVESDDDTSNPPPGWDGLVGMSEDMDDYSNLKMRAKPHPYTYKTPPRQEKTEHVQLRPVGGGASVPNPSWQLPNTQLRQTEPSQASVSGSSSAPSAELRHTETERKVYLSEAQQRKDSLRGVNQLLPYWQQREKDKKPPPPGKNP